MSVRSEVWWIKELWHVIRMYDVGSTVLNGIKSVYVNDLTCVRVKLGVLCLLNFSVDTWIG